MRARFANQADAGRPPAPALAEIFLPGRALMFTFDAFTARVTFGADRTLSLEVIEGENNGFTDDVRYEVHAVRDDVVVLSWQEHIGSTVTHVLDLAAGRDYATVAPASGGFLRLTGTVRRS